MATITLFDQFVEDLAKGVHNLSTGTIKVALCAAANAPVVGNTVLANLTEIAYTNLSARVVTVTSAEQVAGVLKLILADLVLTASGGAVAPFRYVVLYNDTPTSPADPLIGFYDYGSDLTLSDTDTITLDFDGTNGALSITGA